MYRGQLHPGNSNKIDWSEPLQSKAKAKRRSTRYVCVCGDGADEGALAGAVGASNEVEAARLSNA